MVCSAGKAGPGAHGTLVLLGRKPGHAGLRLRLPWGGRLGRVQAAKEPLSALAVFAIRLPDRLLGAPLQLIGFAQALGPLLRQQPEKLALVRVGQLERQLEAPCPPLKRLLVRPTFA